MSGNLHNKLVNSLSKWNKQLAAGGLGDTHMGGIAGKAATQFEQLLRDVLAAYLVQCGLDYASSLKPKLRKDVLRLTLGELIQCLRMLNEELTQCLRSQGPLFKPFLLMRRLVIPKEFDVLDKINEMKQKLSHRREEFDEDPVNNTSELLSWTSQALALPLFQMAELIKG